MSILPSEQQFLVTERQLRALHNTYALNEGWPFGDGPLRWNCHFQTRPANAFSDLPDEMHVICDLCPQSIFCLTRASYHRGFTWNLELLKARIADHVLKVHPEAAT